MKGILKPKVKICCIHSIKEAQMAIKYGANSIGLVGKMPSGPGPIDDDLISIIAEAIPPKVSTFLLTSETTSSNIIQHHNKVNTTTIQIVDKLTEGTYEDIRRELPKVEIVQVVHVLNEESISEAIHISRFVDYILLDSGNPNLKVKEFGGTGRVHDWEISKKIREMVEVPVYLAGGLNPQNIRDAIETVQPYGVDLCNGVRTNNNLDEIKLKQFFESIKNLN